MSSGSDPTPRRKRGSAALESIASVVATAQIVAGAYVHVPLAHSLELRDPKTGALVAELP